MSFQNDLRNFSDNMRERLESEVKVVLLDLTARIQRNTPVDTGRLRGNWQVSWNIPIATTTSDNLLTIQDNERYIRGREILDKFWITNNLPYVYRIEFEGWSHTKAPAGMVRKSIAEVTRRYT